MAFSPLSGLNVLVSLSLLRSGAIFKVLPDTPSRGATSFSAALSLRCCCDRQVLEWLVSGATAAGSAHGAASALFPILFGSYYSTQTFPFGAEVTRAVFRRVQ
jgi:hypothetical protein